MKAECPKCGLEFRVKKKKQAVSCKSPSACSHDELSEAFEIIHRYRTETPLGNQPHMIAEKAGEWLKRNANKQSELTPGAASGSKIGR